MPSPRHRALRQRSIIASLLLVLLASSVLTVASLGGPPPASAASAVSKSLCKRFDPNIVNGVCLKYRARSGTGYTWIGSYRATTGKIFFCIDFLYDSRIYGSAATVGTEPLVNQFGSRVGNAEVAALNYLISTWAPHGSTGSNQNDAAIALIIREVMADAIRPDGTVVYQPGLKVGGTVAAPIGGLSGGLLYAARSMWRKASLYRGPGRLVLAGGSKGRIELGDTQEYRVAVVSASHHPIPGLKVTFRCYGPISCPRSITTKTHAVILNVKPNALGKASIKASTSAPAGDGKLLKLESWRTHSGRTARDNGVQRGWIGQRNSTAAKASLEAEIIKGTPEITTRTSTATAVPGTALRDLVTISGLPNDTERHVIASLFGPFPSQPGADSCTESARVGQASFAVTRNGTVTTPPVTVNEPGYYVWTESLPGDDWTNPVTTPCGIVEETTVVERPRPRVPNTPMVHTVASSRHLLVGSPIHDLVLVGGLLEGQSVEVRWTLLGPIAPRRGSCAGLDWTRAPVIAKGALQATRNGLFRTTPVEVRAPGCVTFTERLPATAGTAAISTRPGEASETVLVTRPAVPVVPEIPSGPTR
jgi:hypothetical protein